MNSLPSASPRRHFAPGSFSLFRFILSVLVLMPLAVLPPGYALPVGGQVAAGDVAIAQAGGTMTLTQATKNAIVNWRSFSVGAGETLRVAQGGADAAMLARVTGNDPSALLGSLQADGRLFLINPKGVVVGEGAVIDTAGFMASTLDVSDADFLRGTDLTFKGDNAAGIVNFGTITAREGSVLLFAHTVKNTGTIAAPNGTAALVAGTEVHLASADNPAFSIKFNLAATSEKTGVDNSGAIAAAQARLEAAGGSIYALAVNQSGVVRATGVATRNGRVILTAAGGTVGVSGEVSARNADGSGGEILVGGDFQGKNAAVPNAARTVVTAAASLDASAATESASAGRVIVWADDATRFLGSLNATGAGGGFAEVSGKHWLDFDPSSPVRLGADGDLRLDPDALIVSAGADSGTSTSGTDPFVFGVTTEPARLNVTTLQNQLALTSVTLDTSASAGDISVDSPVTWSGNNTLRLQAGGSINLNASLSGGTTSTLELYPGKAAVPTQQGLFPINPQATLAAAATISVGTLTYGSNAAAAPANYTIVGDTGVAGLQGTLRVRTLEVDLAGGSVAIDASGAHNAIGTFRTVGSGDLGFANVADSQGGLNVRVATTNSSAGLLRITTPGTLTLQAGSSFSFANPASVVLASTGAGFVNQAGAGVFGANARYLIYASNPGATTKGGLAGLDVFSHPYDANDDFSGDSLSRFLFSAASGLPFLTYTANSASRTYGAFDPAFSATVTGFQQGIPDDVTGAPTFSTTATQSSGVGSYTLNLGRGTLASSNYDFTFVPGTLTITAAPLIITADDQTRRQGLANPALTVSYNGFVLGQDASVVSGLTVTTPAGVSSPVGAYAITPAGATAPNYAITFVPGTLNVTATALLTITADDASRFYGAADPAFSASYAGFVGGDDASIVSGLQFSTTATQRSGIGLYEIVPFGATATGYTIGFQPGTLSILRAPLTLSIASTSRPYGDANPDFAVAYNGLVNGDDHTVVSGLSVTTTATPASSVGNYPITLAGASADNYSITYSPGTLAVTPAPLTVTIDAKTRAYGDANPALTYSVSGLKNGDNAADVASITDLAVAAPARAGIGAYGILGTAFSISPNYTATAVPGTLTITPRPLTISASDATRVYGDPNPAFSATLSGLVYDDTSAVVTSLNFIPDGGLLSGVGHYAITPTGTTSGNYSPVFVPGTLTITPATLTGMVNNASRLYGDGNPAFTFGNVVGFKNSDSLLTLTGVHSTFSTTATPASNVGDYTVAGSATADNYVITLAPGTLTVAPAPLTVTIASASRLYGQENPAFAVAGISGFKNADTREVVSGLSLGTAATAASNAGTYAIDGSATADNYAITIVPGTLTVGRAAATITAGSGSRVFGDTLALITSYSGFLSMDQALARSAWATSPDIPETAPGLHLTGFTQNDAAAGATIQQNYLVTFVTGSLAVTPRPIDVTAASVVAPAGAVPATFAVMAPPPLAFGPAYSIVAHTSANNSSFASVYPITPEVVPGAGVTPAELAQYYTFNLIPGQLTLTLPTTEFDPSYFAPTTTTLTPVTSTLSPDAEKLLTTDRTTKITVTAPTDVAYDTPPLTLAEYASYFDGFAPTID
ncbi:MAG TPA: MBG domain-containing protein, partial [Opitutus sp.]|nr:MBG domain-containing protein [Opitutus sp.]